MEVLDEDDNLALGGVAEAARTRAAERPIPPSRLADDMLRYTMRSIARHRGAASFESMTARSWWTRGRAPPHTHVTCAEHNVKNIVQHWSGVIVKTRAEASSEASFHVGDGDPLTRVRSTDEFFRWPHMLHLLDSIDPHERVTIKAALLGAGDRQHTELQRAVFESEAWVHAMWISGCVREACALSIIGDYARAVLDRGLLPSVRREFHDAAYVLASASLGIELTHVCKQRHRVFLHNQAVNIIAHVEAYRTVQAQHPTAPRVDWWLGTNIDLEHKFGRLHRAANDRGNAEQVSSSLVKTEAVSQLHAKHARHRSRKYTISDVPDEHWNDGSGMRMYVNTWVYGEPLEEYELRGEAYKQKKKQKQAATRAGRGKDATTRTYHVKYASG